MAALFAFLHHLAAFCLFGALVVELIVLRTEPTVPGARRLRAADAVYGASAGILLVVGLARVFHFEKGAAYYFHTWTFLAKLALFVVIGVLSIAPTREFLSWRKAVSEGRAPAVSVERLASLRRIVHWELVGVVLIILMAALMAKGIGQLV